MNHFSGSSNLVDGFLCPFEMEEFPDGCVEMNPSRTSRNQEGSRNARYENRDFFVAGAAPLREIFLPFLHEIDW